MRACFQPFSVHSVTFLFLLFLSRLASADVDLSNPMHLVFVADKTDAIIDVIDVRKSEVVFRIETPYKVDQLVVTPNAPLLFFSNIEQRAVVAYNLSTQEIDREFKLSVTPRHMVLDPSGKMLGISDDQSGGIAILNSYSRDLRYENTEFPATAELLFDPNEIDLYYTNNQSGALGILDLNNYTKTEIALIDTADTAGRLSAPSRSLDGRYIYVADTATGEIFSLNAYSGVVYKTFHIGAAPVRPYTTPEGVFLYMLDADSGRFVAVEQNTFTAHVDVVFESGVDLVTVGRFDRMNLLLSSGHRHYYIYDNFAQRLVATGEFPATPLDAQGLIDGKNTYVAFADQPMVANVNIEDQRLVYMDATNNGAGAFAVGATNNVCH